MMPTLKEQFTIKSKMLVSPFTLFMLQLQTLLLLKEKGKGQTGVFDLNCSFKELAAMTPQRGKGEVPDTGDSTMFPDL